MSFKFNDTVDFLKNQAQNFVAHVLAAAPGSPTEGQVYENSTDHTLEFYNGTAFIKLGKLDQITAPAADVSLNSHKITSLSDGTAAGDAVNKSQLDAAIAGLKWKSPGVRAATTAAGTLATSFENGDTIDGVVLATGDRILIKDQAAPEANGIYVVAASGAPTRSTDADSAAELLQAAVFVSEGTTNGNTGWTMTTDAPITLNTTGLVWAQFSGTTLSAGAGLTLTGSTIDAVAASALATAGPGGGLKVAANDIAVDKDVVVVKFNGNIGDGSSVSIDTTHNLGTKDAHATFRDNSTDEELHPTVSYPSTTVVRSVWSAAPSTNGVRCVVKA